MPAARPEQMGRFNRSYEYDGLGTAYARFLSRRSCRKSASSTSSPRPERPRHRRLELRRHRRLHRGLGAPRRLPPRAQLHRQLHQPARRRRLITSSARPSPSRCASSCRTARRPEHLLRQLVAWPTRTWPVAGVRGLRREVRRGHGGHNSRHGSAILPDALRWLWREYPKPMSPEGQAEHAPLHHASCSTRPRLGTGRRGLPVRPRARRWTATAISSSATRARKIYRVGADRQGHASSRTTPAGRTGLMFGPDGRLYAAESARKRIVAYRPDGAKLDVLATGGDTERGRGHKQGRRLLTDTPARRVYLLPAEGGKAARSWSKPICSCPTACG